MKVNRFVESVCGLQTVVLRGKSITAHNIKIKRNKLFWGFVRNLKVSASNLHLWLMKVYRYLSPKKIYFFNPFFVISNFCAPEILSWHCFYYVTAIQLQAQP
jgi:hypothetical protein